jgi:hypothetical protein
MNRGAAMAGGLVLLAALAVTTSARSHTGGSTGYAALAIDDATIRYTLTLWPTTLPAAIRDDMQALRAGDPVIRDRVLLALVAKIALVADGRPCSAGAPSLARAAGESVTLAAVFTCADAVHELRVRDDVFDVLGGDHHTLARVDAAGRTWQLAFAPDAREAKVRLGESSLGVWGFVRLGVEHIITGYDHLLFLVGLLLPGGGFGALAKIVTAFTAAHSVTLSLAVLDVVVLPDRLVEAVIALSIAAVAAENLVRRATVGRRWIVSLCFGLVHGFGFSSALRELGLPAQGLVASLLGFNVGVELGQGLVVAVLLPLMIVLRQTGQEPRLVWGSSMAILLVGLVLFVERTFL